MAEDDKLDKKEKDSNSLWADVWLFSRLKSIFTKILEIDRKAKGANGFWTEIRSIGEHTIALALILISIWLIQWLLKHLLGEDIKLFDWIKLRYIFELADALVVASYLGSLARKLWRVMWRGR